MDVQALKAIIHEEDRILFGDRIPPKYQSDTLGRLRGQASALVFVKSTAEVSEIMKFAHKNRIPVTPRGDSNVHLCVVRADRDEETWQRELHETMDKAYHMAYALGGVTSGEHGIGISKRRYFLRETPQGNLRVMNSIKDALDPLHILNDKKSYISGDSDETTV